MDETERLERLGLSPTEARAYLALVRHGSLSATGVAEAVGVPRTSIYPALASLTEKGLAESGAGYRGRFRAVDPRDALGLLIDREREALTSREHLAKELAEDLALMTDPREGPPEEVIQVIKHRRGITERWERLQLEAEREIDVFVKSPFISTHATNPAEAKALRRGVQVRALYERSVLSDEAIGPYLTKWISAGEEARVYPGDLPLKLALFDRERALIPLETPHERHPVTAVVISHHALGSALQMFFDTLWDLSQPLGG